MNESSSKWKRDWRSGNKEVTHIVLIRPPYSLIWGILGGIGLSNIQYDRDNAVAYAMTWWNRHNPAFPIFSVDCTNYVSQCLYAGGMEMSGAPNREVGWWSSKTNWSLSWSVAHSLYWYLLTNQDGIRGVTVQDAEALHIGDVICYDFSGNKRWDHTTIVVAKDEAGYPLVNAHTDNSLLRNYAYRDSLAYTRNINYAFIHIESDLLM